MPGIRQALSAGCGAGLLLLELGKVLATHSARRDESKRRFRQALAREGLPTEVVEELSKTYEEGLLSIRDLVRKGGFK